MEKEKKVNSRIVELAEQHLSRFKLDKDNCQFDKVEAKRDEKKIDQRYDFKMTVRKENGELKKYNVELKATSRKFSVEDNPFKDLIFNSKYEKEGFLNDEDYLVLRLYLGGEKPEMRFFTKAILYDESQIVEEPRFRFRAPHKKEELKTIDQIL